MCSGGVVCYKLTNWTETNETETAKCKTRKTAKSCIIIYYGRPRIKKIVFHPRYSSSSTSPVGLGNDLTINFEQT
jgi:hypothetical protein